MFLKKAAAIAALVVAVAGFYATVATAAPAPSAVHRVWKATGTGVRSIECVTPSEIKLLGTNAPKRPAGLTNTNTRKVYLINALCSSITRWTATGDMDGWTVMALLTVGHEAAHLRSVNSERKAECLGVRFAMNYMRRSGVFARYEEAGIRKYLLDDSDRSKAYKLNGTCTL
jgi:hypothetical protein